LKNGNKPIRTRKIVTKRETCVNPRWLLLFLIGREVVFALFGLKSGTQMQWFNILGGFVECFYLKRSSLKRKELFNRHVWDKKQFGETRIVQGTNKYVP